MQKNYIFFLLLLMLSPIIFVGSSSNPNLVSPNNLNNKKDSSIPIQNYDQITDYIPQNPHDIYKANYDSKPLEINLKADSSSPILKSTRLPISSPSETPKYGVYSTYNGLNHYQVKTENLLNLTTEDNNNGINTITTNINAPDINKDIINSMDGGVYTPPPLTFITDQSPISLVSITCTNNKMLISNTKSATPNPDTRFGYFPTWINPYTNVIDVGTAFTEDLSTYNINKVSGYEKSPYNYWGVASITNSLDYAERILSDASTETIPTTGYTWASYTCNSICGGDLCKLKVNHHCEPIGGTYIFSDPIDSYNVSPFIPLCDSPSDILKTATKTMQIKVNANLKGLTFINAYLQLRFMIAEYGDFGLLSKNNYHAQLKIVLNYNSYAFDEINYLTSQLTENFGEFFDKPIYFTDAIKAKLGDLKEIIVSITGNPDGIHEYPIIGIDSFKLGYTVKSDWTAETYYLFKMNLPKSMSKTEGIDLNNPTLKQNLLDLIESITFSYEITFPSWNIVSGHPMSQSIRLTSPLDTIRNPYRNIIDWKNSISIFDRTGSENNLVSETKVFDKTTTRGLNFIRDFINYLSYRSQFGEFYFTSIFIESIDPIGTLDTTKLIIDYFKCSIQFKSTAQKTPNTAYSSGSSFFFNDESKAFMFREDFSSPSLFGLSKTDITLKNIPIEYSYALAYINVGGIETLTTISSAQITISGNFYSIHFAIPSQTYTDFTIFFTSPNYLKTANYNYSRGLVKDSGGNKVQVELNRTEFCKNDVMKINATLDQTKLFLTTSTQLTCRFRDSITKEIVYPYGFGIDHIKPTFDTLSPWKFEIDNLDLSQFAFEYNHTYDIDFLYFNEKETFSAFGYLNIPHAFRIKNNSISNPLYDFDTDYIYYNFTTNADDEYTAIVVSRNTKGKEYIIPDQQIGLNLTSGKLILNNSYIHNNFVKGFTTYLDNPNPTLKLEFTNTDDTNDQTLIIDEVRIVPYFYRTSTFDSYLLKQTNIQRTLTPLQQMNLTISCNFTTCNTTFSRGIYTYYLKFHEDSAETNETYINNTLFVENINKLYGIQYNMTLFEGLHGEQNIGGNFTKNPDSSMVICYIMDKKGYGDTSTYSNDVSHFYGNQFSPQISLISPADNALFKTSYIQIASSISDPNGDIDYTKIRIWNMDFDTDSMPYNQSTGGYYLAIFNPFELYSGTLYIDIEAKDLNDNFAFASIRVRVESFKKYDLTQKEINLGKVNIYPTQTYVPCTVKLNYADINLDQTRTFYLDLGSEFADARSYKIQRSPINIYYPEKDSSNGISDIGRYSYWKFREYNQNDSLSFTLNAPISTISIDPERTTTTKKEWFIYLKRHTNLRTYNECSIIVQMTQPFNKMDFAVLDITGGENISITNQINLVYGKAGLFDEFYVNFTIPMVLKGVDYVFKLIIQSASTEAERIAESRPTNIIAGILFGSVIGLTVRFLLSLSNRFSLKGKKSSTQYIIAVVIGAGIGAILGYFGIIGA